jgi:hypothetical protein
MKTWAQTLSAQEGEAIERSGGCGQLRACEKTQTP